MNRSVHALSYGLPFAELEIQNPCFFEQLDVFFAQVLNSAIGVVDATRLGLSPIDRHPQRRYREIPVDPLGDVPADHTP